MFFSLITCFAAGMLISISLCHILPEANDMYATHLKAVEAAHEAEEKAELAAAGEVKKPEGDVKEEEGEEEGEHHDEEEVHGEHEEEGEHGFPLPNVLFFGGFMFMLLIDRIVFRGKMEKAEVVNDHITKKTTGVKTNPNIDNNDVEIEDLETDASDE